MDWLRKHEGLFAAINRITGKMDGSPAPLHQFLPAIITESSRSLFNVFERVDAHLRSPQVQQLVSTLAHQHKVSSALEEAGWLPHPAIPDDVVMDTLNEGTASVSNAVEEYLSNNWGRATSVFRDRFQKANLDQEAAAALDEALLCRGHNLHRATCRIVFPEIERFARIRLPLAKPTNITSLKEIRERIGKFTPAQMQTYGYKWLPVFQHIAGPCYHKVDASSDMSDFQIPNRHAIAHGILPYSTPADSMNSLVIADFMLNAIDALAASPSEPAPPT